MECKCIDCSNCWRDDSVGYRECTCEDEFTDKEIVDFIEDGKEGCPHYVEAEVVDEYEYLCELERSLDV